MWKPGSAKPSALADPKRAKPGAQTKEPEQRPIPNNNNGSNRSTKKKLSGATLGMRFMKRRIESQAKPANKDAETAQTAMAVCSGDESDSSEPNKSHIPSLATASDMYGLKSDLIGRRSFGSFNKNVSETWKSNLTAYSDGGAEKGAKKQQQLSDEELLRRYEVYIKGRGNLGEIDKAAAAPVGNLTQKINKQKKRKSQSPPRGEKRKRP